MKILRCTTLALTIAALLATSFQATAQQTSFDGSDLKVNQSVQEVEIIVNTAKRLEFEYDIPDMIVENDQIIRVRPVARNQILIIGLRPGVTAVTVSNPKGELQHIEVEVVADVRDLQRIIKREFPSSNVRAIPMKTGVMLTGTIGSSEDINTIIEVTKQYFPEGVINRTVIDGSQMVAIEVKVYEVSRTKLRRFGVDWAVATSGFNIGSSVAGIIQTLSPNPGTLPTAGSAPITFGVLSDGKQLSSFIDTLEQKDIAKLLDQPTLIALNGRAAEFLSGGEIPIQVAAGLSSNAIEFRPFGTRLDIVPKIHGNGRMRLELRAEVSEVANDLSSGTGVPGFRVRRINTAVEMSAGNTLALAGDYREEQESQARGIPGLMSHPAIGTIFRRVQDTRNETELVFLVTPRFVSDVEPGMMTNQPPGRLTQSPSDTELYLKGYIEVPSCGDDCNIDQHQHVPYSQAPAFGQQSNKTNAQPAGFNPNQTRQTSPQSWQNQRLAPGQTPPKNTQNGFGYPQSKTYSIGNNGRVSYNGPRQQKGFNRVANNRYNLSDIQGSNTRNR